MLCCFNLAPSLFKLHKILTSCENTENFYKRFRGKTKTSKRTTGKIDKTTNGETDGRNFLWRSRRTFKKDRQSFQGTSHE